MTRMLISGAAIYESVSERIRNIEMNRDVVLTVRGVRAHIAQGLRTLVDANGTLYALQDATPSELFLTAWRHSDAGGDLPAPGDLLVISNNEDQAS